MQTYYMIFERYIAALLISCFAILAPVQPLILAVLVLVIADMVLGVSVAIKTNIPVTSKGLRNSIIKMMTYLVAIIAGYICEKYLLGDMLPVTKLFTAMIGISELKSVLENAEILTGNKLIHFLTEKLNAKNAKNLIASVIPSPSTAKVVVEDDKSGKVD